MSTKPRTNHTSNKRLRMLAAMLEAAADLEDAGAPMNADEEDSAKWFGVTLEFIVSLGDFSARPRYVAQAVRKFIKTRSKA